MAYHFFALLAGAMINAAGYGSRRHSNLCVKCVRNFFECACPISDPGQRACPRISGDIYEGLLERNAQDTKSGARQ